MTEHIGIDIGGSGIKGAPVDIATGALTAERYRLPTPHPATPDAVADTVLTPPARMAPALKPKDVRQEYVYGLDAESIRKGFLTHLEFTLAELPGHVDTEWEPYLSLALPIRDRLIERWVHTQNAYYAHDAKRVYYLSLEFLMGRALGDSLVNLGFLDAAAQAMHDLGYAFEDLIEAEWDAGLGNGGLGRLAACFLDSLATLALPAYGYDLRYEYGMFHQRLVNGYQVEVPDAWLRYGHPWEIPRPHDFFRVKFYGRVHQYVSAQGRLTTDWVDTEDILTLPYDTPIPGYQNGTVNTLRLWSAKATDEFDLRYFNRGDYEGAVEAKSRSENITRVLYPNDNIFEGKELRLKQEYFFVSATLQDIIRRYKKRWEMFDKAQNLPVFARFADKNAIQLNDTHPALAIPELMRLLVDVEQLDWETAWDVTISTFAYTNHTVMPEALERWTVDLLGRVLPRHLQIIYEINHRFLTAVRQRFPNDDDRCRRMSIIEEGPEQRVRMAHLAIVGGHVVNGVAALHTDILKTEVFRDFYELWPEKFSNKTNGITQRRWLKKANPPLSALITEAIGEGWVTDLFQLQRLAGLAADAAFAEKWRSRQARQQAAPYGDYQVPVPAPGPDAYPQPGFALRLPGQTHPRVQAAAAQRLARYHAVQPHQGRPARQPPAAHHHLWRQGGARLFHGQADHQTHHRHWGQGQPRCGRGGLAAGGVPGRLPRLAGGAHFPGRRAVGADLHRRDRGLRHGQYEVCPQRRPHHWHDGRC